jgi:hypothetical protein
MTTTYHLTPRAHLLLAIEALKFAMEQKAVSAETRRKIGVALASARRDLARQRGKTERRTRERKPA